MAPPATRTALLGYLAAISLLLHCLLPSLAGADFVYNGFEHAANLSLDGSASVLRGGALRLTHDSNSLMGHAFFDSPVQVVRGNSVISFSTAFVFDIVTVDHGGGHGLAFVVAASKALPGASYGIYLGLLGENTNGNSSNHVFAVEFDTMQVRRLNETDSNHVGVDLNSVVSNVSEPAGYFDDDDDGRNISVKLESAQPIQAWVDYDGRTKVLNVTIAPVSVPSRPHRPLISRAIDLLPVFKREMYVGFSSSTGEKLASSHYILAWSFSTEGAAKAIDLSRLPKVPKQAAPPPSLSTVIEITASSCVATLVVIAAAIVLALWIRRRAALTEMLEDWELDHPQRLPYKELYAATNGFEASKLLGAGGFGQVYKGVLRCSGDEVAIKRISSSGTQGMREFVAEVASLGRMRHRNLVELRGWCKRGQDLLLVYEFMPNGSLDEHLFGRAGAVMPPKPLLTWGQRVGILRGVASGLVYLHEEWEQVVVHRDVKASNVLLGADMAPRLGDFGLARLYEHGADPATTRIVGTLGYMAPELTVTARASRATDLFAFGVLLLEVACGCRPIDPVTGESLLRRVRGHHVSGDLVRAVDERLDGCYDKKEARLVLWLGLMCSQSRPEARPSMRQACQYLDGELEMREEAVLVFSDVDSLDVGSSAFLTWSSCNTMSGGSLLAGR
uniref:non-specific serine/threonine protein kinase n=2 Tax=Setaria viridis TaxID=4556 RepID=A0A4V6D4Q8_SETVI|nr:L-type lectin-domain containing receptor kinase IV.1-like [Setaria viridis]TKV95145.1 hypothetical protein SEVIR_9G341900v2 [Setaria viridis]